MELVNEALSFIPDDSEEPLDSYPGIWEIGAVVNSWQKFFPNQVVLTPKSPGKELKAVLMALPPNLQAEALAPLLNKQTPGLSDAQTAPQLSVTQLDQLEDRKLFRWLVKMGTWTTIFCVVVLVTTVCVIGIKSGAIPDIPFFSGMVSIAQSIIPVFQLWLAPSS